MELKSVDTSANIAVDTTSAVQLVNGIARGDDIGERTGRKVVMKSIEWRGISYATAATGVDQVHRIMLVYDKYANATALTTAMVLNSGTNFLSMKLLENRRRFKILWDKLIYINATAEAQTGKVMHEYLNLNLPVIFNNGDNGTVADIVSGSLYFCTVGNIVAGNTAGTFTVNCRVRFADA